MRRIGPHNHRHRHRCHRCPHRRCSLLHTRRWRLLLRCNRQHRHRCHRCRHRPCKFHRRRRWRRAGCRCSHSRRPGCRDHPQTPHSSSWLPLQSQSPAGMSEQPQFVDGTRSAADSTGVEHGAGAIVDRGVGIVIAGRGVGTAFDGGGCHTEIEGLHAREGSSRGDFNAALHGKL